MYVAGPPISALAGASTSKLIVSAVMTAAATAMGMRGIFGS